MAHVGVLIPGNMIGGGTKMPVRLASHLAEFHEVTLVYPQIKHYHRLSKLTHMGPIGRARHVLREFRGYQRRFVWADDLDGRVALRTYAVRLTRGLLEDFDAVIYASVWQYHELEEVDLPSTRRIHWSLADYLYCSGIDNPVNPILEAYLGEDTLVAPSAITAAALATYGADVDAIIPGGIDPIFHASGRVLDDWNGPPSILGYYQPGWWVKGAATLLQVVRRIRVERPEVRIELFGHRPADIAETGSVLCDRFHTALSSLEVAKLLRRHRIFLYPSYTDGFPSPPLEAMACGCAVVGTRVGALPEYADDGRTALLCNPLNADAMYRAAIRLVDHPDEARGLGEAAAASATAYTWRACAERFSELIGG